VCIKFAKKKNRELHLKKGAALILVFSLEWQSLLPDISSLSERDPNVNIEFE